MLNMDALSPLTQLFHTKLFIQTLKRFDYNNFEKARVNSHGNTID